MDSEASWTAEPDVSPELSSILGDGRQRRILSILRDQSDPVSVRDLSVQLAAQQTGTPSELSEEDYRSIQIDLHHRCLPKLETVGWIERHPEGVVPTESFPFTDDQCSVPDLEATDDSVWEAVGALLAHPRRQKLISIVADRHPPITVEELAAELADHSDTSGQCDVDPVALGTLHHVDLPRLTTAGLIEYDPDEKTITRTCSPITLADRLDLGDRLTEAIDGY